MSLSFVFTVQGKSQCNLLNMKKENICTIINNTFSGEHYNASFIVYLFSQVSIILNFFILG